MSRLNARKAMLKLLVSLCKVSLLYYGNISSETLTSEDCSTSFSYKKEAAEKKQHTKKNFTPFNLNE